MGASLDFAAAMERAERLVPTLASRARETEALRRIPDQTIRDLTAAGLFRILQPRRVGGAELPYEILVRVSSILARGCGSTSWVFGNLANHAFMLGLWPIQAQQDVWSDSADQLVGSALMFPPGRATRVDGGYRLTGRWKFSSGIDACTWCMLGGIASADGELPDYRVFLVPKNEYETIDTRYAAGLRGTGSKDVAVSDIFVPEYRSLAVERMKGCNAPGAEVNPGPLYRLPVFDMFPYVVSATALGLAQAAVDMFVDETRHRVTSYSTTLMSDHATTQLRRAKRRPQWRQRRCCSSETACRRWPPPRLRACPPPARRSGCAGTEHMRRGCARAPWTCSSRRAAASSCTKTRRCSARFATCTPRRAITASRGTWPHRPPASSCSASRPTTRPCERATGRRRSAAAVRSA
jgi:alkylation response protein AidB-like acyl-CoA dehydrogenase